MTERAVRHGVVRASVFVAVTLVVAAAGIRVVVPRPPDVRGLNEQQAIRELKDAGYRVVSAHFDVDGEGENVDCYAPSGTVGVVIGQRPCPGWFSSVPEGSRVMLWIKIPGADCIAPPDANWGCA